MESTKIAIFLIFFVAFIVIARRMFSGDSTVHASELTPQPPPDYGEGHSGSKAPAAIGAELPFPVALPPVMRLPNGRYNRPHVLNYYFSNLDLKRGPDNPRSFCDQFFVQFEAPETGEKWSNEYTVATPFGLQDLLDQSGQDQTFYGTIIIVSRWDMAHILRTVLDDVMDGYVGSDDDNVKAGDTSRSKS